MEFIGMTLVDKIVWVSGTEEIGEGKGGLDGDGRHMHFKVNEEMGGGVFTKEIC